MANLTQVEREHAARVLQEFFDFNKTLTPQSDLWLQADITINRYTQKELGKALPAAIAALREPLGTAETCTVEQAKDAPWINVHDRLPDNARWVLGARRDDDVREMRYRRNWKQGYWDNPSIESPDPIYWREMPEVPQPKEKEWSGALAGTDAADKLRWLLFQAERAGVLLDKHDHEAVTLACDALEGRIDVAPGFDSDRSGQRQEAPQMTKDEAIAYFERQVRLCDYLAEHIAERHIPEGHNYSVEAFLADTMRDKEAYTIALEAIRKND